MIFIIDQTNEEPKLIGPFSDSEAATHWGCANLKGGANGAWGWYEAIPKEEVGLG